VFLLIILGLLAAPFQRPTDIVRWNAAPVTTAVSAGGTLRIQVKATVERGWKLYAMEQPAGGPAPLAFRIPEEAPYRLNTTAAVAPKPKIWKDDNFDLQTRYYEREAEFILPVSVDANASAGRGTIPLEVTFQACGQNICLRPFTQKLNVDVEIKR